MANIDFEGSIQGISETQLNYIRRVLNERGFENGKVTVEPVGKAGDNWQANVKRLMIEKDGNIFKMIAKIAPNNDILRLVGNTAIIFQNEHIFYTELVPKFTALEKKANIPEQDKFNYAVCYGSFTQAPHEVILLEDLAAADFVMLNRFDCFSDQTLKLVLCSLAHYHALSHVLKNRDPESYNAIANKLINPLDIVKNSDMMAIYAEQLEAGVLAILQSERDKKLVKGSILSLKHINVETDPKYSIIKQGDTWTNNIMFKIKNKNPDECCMIDYQQCAIGSPVFDLHFMIFNCTDHKSRSKRYQQWIDYYHSELDKSLNSFGLKSDEIYPKSQLEVDLKNHAKLSFSIAILLAAVSTKEASEAAVAKDAYEKDGNMELLMKITSETGIMRFKNKVEDLIESFIQLNYLN